MAKEIGRGARLGKYIAKSIKQFSSPEFQEAVKKPSYIETIRRILSEADFEPRKRGSPNPKNNKSLLEQIPYDEFNICHPEHYAALLIERGHINYNARTANRIRKSLLENL
jgi:hypothetical protein